MTILGQDRTLGGSGAFLMEERPRGRPMLDACAARLRADLPHPSWLSVGVSQPASPSSQLFESCSGRRAGSARPSLRRATMDRQTTTQPSIPYDGRREALVAFRPNRATIRRVHAAPRGCPRRGVRGGAL
jgi:hypothetical protein